MTFSPMGVVSWGLAGQGLGAGAMVPDKITVHLERDEPLSIGLESEGLELTLSDEMGGWFGPPGQFG